MSFNPLLPFLALSSLGGVVVSFGAGAYSQNPIARYLYNDIPRGAKPYPNWFERNRTTRVESNDTWVGMGIFFSVFGGAALATRIAINPLLPLLRKKFTYIPGTNTPRRIKGFFDLLYDVCPDVIMLTTPLIPALPLAFAAKVAYEGPGRFRNFSKQWNPYDSQVARYEAIYSRPTLATAPLRKVSDDNFHIARPLCAISTHDQVLRDHAVLNNNCY